MDCLRVSQRDRRFFKLTGIKSRKDTFQDLFDPGSRAGFGDATSWLQKPLAELPDWLDAALEIIKSK
jgi:hypothetical protein